jgi:hypothetical protein
MAEERIMSEERLRAMPAAAESYRPLSLLALAGFGIAALYALIVIVGAVIALLNRIPWLMPNWTFFIPLAALAVCWVARARIRSAEDTLSGLAFTAWGVRLSVVAALLYAAYYGFTFFAIRLQAIDRADRFFELLKQGRTEQAFLYTQGLVAGGDLNEDELRDEIENRFNNPEGPTAAPGAYSRFRRSEYVRLIEADGSAARLTCLGVTDWGYKGDGYQVVLKYHVATSVAEFLMSVETFGRDPKPGEPKGKQWIIDLKKQTYVIKNSRKLMPRGEELAQQAQMAGDFASKWADKVNRQRWGEAYLDTQEPTRRERLAKGQQTDRLVVTAPLSGLSPLGLCDEVCRDFQAGQTAFHAGTLIRLNDAKFWCSKQHREAIRKRIEQTFRPTGDRAPVNIQLNGKAGPFQEEAIPLTRQADSRVTLLLEVELRYPEEGTTRPQFIVDGQLAVSADERDATRSSSSWQIEYLEPQRGRTPPVGPGPPGRRGP